MGAKTAATNPNATLLPLARGCCTQPDPGLSTCKSLPGLNLIGHGGSGIDDGGASIPIRTFASPVLNGVRDWSSRAGRHETMMPRPAPGSLIDGYRGPARRHPPRHLTPRPI